MIGGLKDICSRATVTCHNCGNLFDEETYLRCHITNKHEDDEDKEGNKSPTFMVSIIMMISRVIEIHKKQTGAELGQAQT